MMTKRQNKGGRRNKGGRAVADGVYSDDPLYRVSSSTLMDRDRLLWQKVAASVRPLPMKTSSIKRPERDVPVWVPPPPLAQNCASAVQPLPVPTSPQGKAVAWQMGSLPTSHISTMPSQKTFSPLSRKAQRRIARQYFDHTSRLDLHGLSQDRAYKLLLHFIHSNVRRNQSLLLVITGKGRSTGSSGILRQLVPQWLASPPFRLHVSAVEQALRHHGGEGAFYVRLRRMNDF